MRVFVYRKPCGHVREHVCVYVCMYVRTFSHTHTHTHTKPALFLGLSNGFSTQIVVRLDVTVVIILTYTQYYRVSEGNPLCFTGNKQTSRLSNSVC